MAGYTPLFDGLLDGTLYGKWPVNGLWVLILSQCDKNGQIDMVPKALADRIGCDLETLQHAIAELMAPDPKSRTKVMEGRRLILIDPARDWGWKVVNHADYREKARLAAKAAREVESGLNAERLRQRAALSRDDPRSPPDTADDRRSPPLIASQTHTHTHTHEEQAGNGAVPENLNVQAWEQWVEYKKRQWKMSYKSPKSKALAMQALADMGSQDYQQTCVDASMAKQWKGIFEPQRIGSSLQQRLNDGLTGDELDN